MERIVASGGSLGPAGIGGEIGTEQGEAFAYIARASLTQHRAQFALTREVADRGARFMPRRQKLDQTMGADKARAPRDQNARHAKVLPCPSPLKRGARRLSLIPEDRSAALRPRFHNPRDDARP
jgi:hypothetical protein